MNPSMNKPVTPKHLGIIMDGNRRWAKAQGLPSLEGHVKGQETLRTISKHAFESGVEVLSAYVFSTENWRRTEEEVSYLMGLVHRAVDKYLDEFHDAGIKVVVVGSRDHLDKKVIQSIEKAEEKTRANTKGTLALCLNYGGHQEIVDATKKIVDEGLEPDDITIETLSSHLYAPEIPPLDLIIRTSGEHRISGFMLWRAEYSELYFTDTHWPGFTEQDLDEALAEYSRRQRRFGK